MKNTERLLIRRRAMEFCLLSMLLVSLAALRDPTDRHRQSAVCPEKRDAAAERRSVFSGEVSVPVRSILFQQVATHPSDAETEFSAFASWAKRYVQSETASRRDLEHEGVKLATARRAAMARLIQEDPKRALELAVPFVLRSQLPDPVATLLERQVNGRGSFDVWIASPAETGEQPAAPLVSRFATIAGREFKTFVYGKKSGLPTRENIPMHGVAVDDFFALHEDWVRMLEPEEVADLSTPVRGEELCGVSELPSNVNGTQTIVEVADEILSLCQPEHAEELNAKLAGDFAVASDWTEGGKKVLFIRVDYSDDTGSPVSASTLTNTLNASSPAYEKYSYNRTRLALFHQGSAWTPVLRMPNTKASYSSLNTILNHAKNAASAAGYTNADYDFHVVCSAKTPVTTANAIAKVGSSGVLMNGSFVATLFSHELGHNYGVWHANFWQSTNAYGLGSGSHLEYGDIFDLMGGDAGGWDLSNQPFNVDHKVRLGWIKSSEFATATSGGGLYRIYTHDNTNSLGKGFLALKIPINSDRNFWVEYRRLSIFPSDNWLLNGVGIRWGYNTTSDNGSRLIDTTPGSRTGGSKADRRDSPVVIGRTFSDYPNGIHITPVGLGGTSPQSIDVRVRLGTFPGNRAPTSVLSGRTSAMVGETLTFTATASDLDGDELAYYWDFANDQFDSANSPILEKSWGATGSYSVRCIVSDMKGGLATNSLTVNVISTPVPPSITSHPQSQTNLVGANVTFSVTATGTAPLSYQWRFNATNVPGATASSYTRTNIQPSDAGTYSVLVSNAANVVLSSNSILGVTASAGPNQAPLLAPIENRTVFSGSLVIFTNVAFDPNPWDTLTFSLDPGAPLTASVHPTSGVFTWIPSDAHTNSIQNITVRVTDNGVPTLSGTASFAVTVLPGNKPPLLAPASSYTIHAGSTVTFTNFAFDPDGHALEFSLDPGAPAEASIDPLSGIFIWATSDADADSENFFTVRVTDSGEPPLSGTVTFDIIVEPRPMLQHVAFAENTAVLTWNAIPGLTYRAEYKNNLDDLNWQQLGEEIVASDFSATANDPGFGGHAHRFYRIFVISSP